MSAPFRSDSASSLNRKLEMDPIKGETSDSSDKEFVSFLDGSPANFDYTNTMTHHKNDQTIINLTKNFCSAD
jgi:hypothetical protein